MKRTAGAAFLLAATVLLLVAGVGTTGAQSGSDNVTLSGEIEGPNGASATDGHILVYQRTSSYSTEIVTRIQLQNSASFSLPVTPGYEYGILFFQSVPGDDDRQYPNDGVPDLHGFDEINVQSDTDAGTLSLPDATRITPQVYQAASETPVSDATFNISTGTAELNNIDANEDGILEIDGSGGIGIEVADYTTISVESTSPEYYSYYLSSEDISPSETQNPTLYLQKNDPPEAVISGPDTARAGEGVVLDASNSSDPDGDIEAIAWDWESDGNADDSSSGYALDYTTDFYSQEPQTFQTTLTVEDEYGLTDTATKTINITEPNLSVSSDSYETDDSVGRGYNITLGAEIANRNNQIANGTATWYIDGQQVETTKVSVEGGGFFNSGETYTIEHSTTDLETGTHSFAVDVPGDRLNGTFDVDEPENHQVGARLANYSLTNGTTTNATIAFGPVYGGLGEFEQVTISIANTSAAAVREATPLQSGVSVTSSTESEVTISGESVDSREFGWVPLADISISGSSPGTTSLSVDHGRFWNQSNSEYASGWLETIRPVGTTLSVQEKQPAPTVLDDPATNVDDDDEFEDINGDGTFDIVDVSALYNNLDSPTVQQNTSAFDFNGDGTVNIVDVNNLFQQISG